jgi:c-di-GMP-binding flagellar brake protein YcgR
MAWDGGEERRRLPRVDVPQQIDCEVEMRARVRLVDISASGALLVTDTMLPVEAFGQLRAVLASVRFSPNLEVKRTATVNSHEGTQLGTAFLGMDDESRRSLEAFLRKATS